MAPRLEKTSPREHNYELKIKFAQCIHIHIKHVVFCWWKRNGQSSQLVYVADSFNKKH